MRKSADGNSPHVKRFPLWPKLAVVSTVSLSSSFTITSYGITSGRREGGREEEGREGGKEGRVGEGKRGGERSECGEKRERESVHYHTSVSDER